MVDGKAASKTTGETLDLLADGAHSVRVEATNEFGYVSSAQTAFTVDTEPPSPTIILKFAQIEAAAYYATAITRNGTLWTWGDNSYGALGDGTTIQRTTPTRIGGEDTNWTSVSAGDTHTVAVKTDGSLWAWGYNGDGELGDGNWQNSYSVSPEKIGSDTNWHCGAAGENYTVALKQTAQCGHGEAMMTIN